MTTTPFTSTPVSGPSDSRAVFFSFTLHYIPTESSSIVMAITFGLLTLVHIALVVRFGGRFMIIAVVSSFLEMLGYCCRLAMTRNPGAWSYLFFLMFTVVTPVLTALINYIAVGKLLILTHTKVRILCKMSAKPIKTIFLIVDVICAVVQTAGSIMLVISAAMNQTTVANIAKLCLLGGLIIQLLFFGAFTYIVARIFTSDTYLDPLRAKLGAPRVRYIFIGLAFTIVMLFIRNIYRVVEFSTEIPHEWVFFVFESVPIALSLIAYAVWHFGYLLSESGIRPYDAPDTSTGLAEIA